MFDYIPEEKKKTAMRQIRLLFYSGAKIPGSIQVWEIVQISG